MQWPDLLRNLTAGKDIGGEAAAAAMDAIMRGNVPAATLGAFLVGLAAKGETVEELRGLADTMRAHATAIDITDDAVDIVGTGGDGAKTVNISTMAAIVIAACGVRVVKHGNRAASSASGSADVLEALGVPLDLPLDQVAAAVDRAGITFLFANVFHPSMRYAAPTRRELGIPTSFNVLGPLTNPACPRANAIGVSSARHAPLMAGVLAERGVAAVVFRGESGLDELTNTTINRVWWVRDGEVGEHRLDASELGLQKATITDLRGGNAQENAQVARRIFSGADGIVAETVALNAAAGLLAYAQASGEGGSDNLLEALRPHYHRAREVMASGAPLRVLEKWAAVGR
ncbi:MAG: anthranilate phosphoribosyltransferase [Bowdeniella nasicola]|nr:anthranilate phosphoribosyltransferase [Bowdeniella nasicola]